MRKKCMLFYLQAMNYVGILVGFTSTRVQLHEKKVLDSKLINYYVVVVNIITVAMLPGAHAISIKYITANFKNNLLTFTDSINLFITYLVVVFSLATRCLRENIYKELVREIFKLDRTFFNKIPLNSRIDKQANWGMVMKMCTVTFVLYVPIYGVFTQAIRVDFNVIMLAAYLSLIHCILHGVLFMFFLLLWMVRKRVQLLNGHLDELLHCHQRFQRNTAGIRPSSSDTAPQLSGSATADLRKIARVHARFTTIILRLNSSYKFQIIAVLLTYILNSISYGYYSLVMMNNTMCKSHTAFYIGFYFAVSAVVILDMNLIYWTADETAVAFQHTADIMREFQALPLMDVAFEQQCETFQLQLKQQKMDINIAGMFSLTRGTSLALCGFNIRHIIILVQFDIEARMGSISSNGVLEHISRLLQFGERWAEE